MGNTGINFSALTAYSEDDSEAAYSIIQTFVEETRKNVGRMRQAQLDKETDGIAAMAHKLLPLFTLIGASQAIAPLKYLESCRGESYTSEIGDATSAVLSTVCTIISEAENYLMSMRNVD